MRKMYNVMFPLWMLIIFPLTWLIVIPANFIIDTIVILISLKLLKIKDISKVYKKSIFKIWIFGFIADIIGGLLLFLTQLLPDSLYSTLTMPIAYNPFTSIWAMLFVLLAIFISGFIIYVLNSRFAFNKTKMSKKDIVKVSLILAIVTAPWMFLYPTQYLYNSDKNIDNIISFETEINTKTTEVQEVLNNLECSTYMNNGVFNEQDLFVSLDCTDNNKITEYSDKFKSNSANENLDKSADEIFEKLVYVNNVVFNVKDDKIYEFKRGK